MTTTTWRRLVALLLAFGLTAAACGSDDEDEDTSAEESSESEDETEDEETSDDAEATDDSEGTDDGEGEEAAAGDLSEVCPETIVIQTDWFPEAEHGALYYLIGDE